EFDDKPGLQSDRGGDPSTSLRQFTRGYIGLQNHSDADKMQYRNVRIEDLTPGAPGLNPTGAFDVAGDGPHTVEFRSVDAAGNVEDKQALPVQIGAVTSPGVAPATPPQSGGGLTPAMIDTPARFTLGRGLSTRMSETAFAKRGLSVPVACTGAMVGSAKLT